MKILLDWWSWILDTWSRKIISTFDNPIVDSTTWPSSVFLWFLWFSILLDISSHKTLYFIPYCWHQPCRGGSGSRGWSCFSSSSSGFLVLSLCCGGQFSSHLLVFFPPEIRVWFLPGVSFAETWYQRLVCPGWYSPPPTCSLMSSTVHRALDRRMLLSLHE